MNRTQLLGGAFTDAAGNLLANGTLVLQLSQDGNLSNGDGQVSGEIKITLNLDSSGNISTSPAQSVWPTDQMSPAGITYTGWVYTAEGQLAWGPAYNLTVPTASSFDVANWTPNMAIAPLASLGTLTVQTNSIDNVDQQTLNLIAGSNVTLDAGVGGDVTINATGGGGSTPLIFASNLSGGDLSVKINAALASLSGAPGEVWIVADTSSWSEDVTLAYSGQVLRFVQGGTYNLGSHAIIISEGTSNCAIIGTKGGSSVLSYTGSSYPIQIGGAGAAMTQNTLLEDVNVSLGSSAAGGFLIDQTLFCHIVRPIINGFASGSFTPVGIQSDGTGSGAFNFSAYMLIEQPTINNCVVGIRWTGPNNASPNNANQLLGGGIVGPGVGVSGSIGVELFGDSGFVFGTDIENYETGYQIHNNYNLLSNCRLEGNTTMFNFSSGSSRNTCIGITRPNGTTVIDAGEFNSVTSGAGLIQQTSLSIAGQVAYTFTEDANAPLNVALRAGSTTDQQGNLQFQDHTGSVQFTIQKDQSSNLFILQQSKSAACFVVGATGAVGVNSNSGALNLNGSSGASTSGTAFFSGGSTPEVVATIDGSGNLTVLPATLATTGNNDSPSINIESNWSPEQASVTAVSVSSGVVTISGNFSAFSVGLQVTVLGLTNPANTWLNGITISVLSRSGSNMTANVSHGNYGTTSDNATAYESEIDDWSIQNVIGTGATPTSTLTITHTGSTGTASLDLENVATAGSAGSASLYLPILVNGSPYKIALLAP